MSQVVVFPLLTVLLVSWWGPQTFYVAPPQGCHQLQYPSFIILLISFAIIFPCLPICMEIRSCCHKKRKKKLPFIIPRHCPNVALNAVALKTGYRVSWFIWGTFHERFVEICFHLFVQGQCRRCVRRVVLRWPCGYSNDTLRSTMAPDSSVDPHHTYYSRAELFRLFSRLQGESCCTSVDSPNKCCAPESVFMNFSGILSSRSRY